MTSSIEFCGTRLASLNGPTHTGAVAKFLPSALVALGLRIIPARSASAAVSGANGVLSLTTTVLASGASTLVMGPSSLLRPDPSSVRLRSNVALTAAASNGVPSANFTPSRTGMVTVLPPSETVGRPVASCGTIFADWSTSYSFSHMAWKT